MLYLGYPGDNGLANPTIFRENHHLKEFYLLKTGKKSILVYS